VIPQHGIDSRGATTRKCLVLDAFCQFFSRCHVCLHNCIDICRAVCKRQNNCRQLSPEILAGRAPSRTRPIPRGDEGVNDTRPLATVVRRARPCAGHSSRMESMESWNERIPAVSGSILPPGGASGQVRARPVRGRGACHVPAALPLSGSNRGRFVEQVNEWNTAYLP